MHTSLSKSNTIMAATNDRSNLAVILDPNIKVQPGKNAQSQILSESFPRSALSSSKSLSLGEVKELWRKVNETNSLSGPKFNARGNHYLHEVLGDFELQYPSLEIPERNPELEKRIISLRNALSERDYQRMTRNVSCASQFNPDDSVGQQLKHMNSGLIAVMQFVISLACAFFFGFTGVELLIGSLQLPVRLLLGIGSSLIVGAAELYFLAVNIAVSEDGVQSFASSSLSQKHLKTS